MKKAATEIQEIQQTTDFVSKPAADLPADAAAVAVPEVPKWSTHEDATRESRYVTNRLYAEGGIGRVWLAAHHRRPASRITVPGGT